MAGYSKMRDKSSNSSPTGKKRSKDIPSPSHDHDEDHENGGGGGERSGVVLSRTCSSASQRFRSAERPPGAMRRAFSMRKTTSDAYRRIHDDTGEDLDYKDGGGDHEDNMQQEERSSKKKRGRIFRACKKIFRF